MKTYIDKGKSIIILFLLLSCKTAKLSNYQISTSASHTVQQIPGYPLQSYQDMDVLIREIGDAKIVLLGEASHGTMEYYTWRTAISQELILKKGFNFIAIEGDWSDAYLVNKFIKGKKGDSSSVIAVLKHYQRWPTWLWCNYEVASLVTWLNLYNQDKPENAKAGFYGLDLFNVWESLQDLFAVLPPSDTAAINAAKAFRQCFSGYQNDEREYATAILHGSEGCAVQAKNVLQSVQKIVKDSAINKEAALVMQQNAFVVYDGELYLRNIKSRTDSWNIRDDHMVETLKRLFNKDGTGQKAIIWLHNSHAGDASYSSMRWADKTSAGELLRKQFGRSGVFIVGFGSYSGSVIAADKWGGMYKRMQLPVADDSTWEHMLHLQGAANKLVLSRNIKDSFAVRRWIYQRSVGVVYNPVNKNAGYSPSFIPGRYDAFIFIDHTNALHPVDSTSGKTSLSKLPSDY